MKITKALVRRFEEEQREHGTATALHNVLWQVAATLYNDLGIKRIRTSTKMAA